MALAKDEGLYDTSGKFAGSYLCIATASGGVKYNKDTRSWNSVTFNVDDVKFALNVKSLGLKIENPKLLGENSTIYSVDVSDFDIGLPSRCSPIVSDFDDSDLNIALFSSGSFACRYRFMEYTFNLTTNRYRAAYLVGYVGGDDDNKDSPYVEIGRCTRLE